MNYPAVLLIAMAISSVGVMAIDAFKARQLSLLAHLGLAIPPSRVVHRAFDGLADRVHHRRLSSAS